MEWAEVLQVIVDNATGIITIIVVLLCRLLGQHSTAEELEAKAKAKTEKKRAKLRKKAECLCSKMNTVVEEIEKVEKESK